MQEFASQIANWYQTNKRDLPWRSTNDPYKIWLSEILLQQTQIKQGLPYYLNFVAAFPTVQDLAKASEIEVIKLWQGLGYYSRARNLHFTAKYIVEQCHGDFPNTYEELIKLKGIGDYTASAIASFAFNKYEAVLDGNVFRVLSRLFDVDLDINSSEGKKFFKDLALELLPDQNAHIHNQAIMEFGALQCTPRNPNCEICPLLENCESFKKGSVSQRPIKLKKLKKKTRYLTFACLDDGRKTVLNRRIQKDIWQNMYEFPCIEGESLASFQEVLNSLHIDEEFQDHQMIELKHVLTHQTLYARLFHIKLKDIKGFETTLWTELESLPVPRLIEKFVEQIKD